MEAPDARRQDARPGSVEAVWAGIEVCRRCDLWRCGNGVAGEGPAHARLMFVGEQPGDQEEQAKRPFIGPSGKILDKALQEAGVPRSETFVTNAVKHFKHLPRGKRRLHKTPDAGEVVACRWWLDAERRIIRPRVIVALGTTAGATLGTLVMNRLRSVVLKRIFTVLMLYLAYGMLVKALALRFHSQEGLN